MSEPNPGKNVEELTLPPEPDDTERVDELTRTWESSPLTDPVQAQDGDAKPLIDHGDTDRDSEAEAQRPDF